MAFEKIFTENAEKFGVDINGDLLGKLKIYAEQLKEWNEKINLTAITDDEGMAVKHFIDCLAIFKYVDFKENSTLLDVGTGAGFPGLVIAAARPDIKVTLLDSTGKKLKAVADIAEKMCLNNVTVLHARAEEAGRQKEYRESFMYVTARAVAGLRTLCEYCLPFVQVGGSFISMKGSQAQEEIDEAQNAVSVLGGQIKKINTFELLNSGERNIIEIKKVSQTPAKYPRASAKISAKPL